MAGIDFLAALGGGLESAGKGLSFAQQFEEDQRQFDETNATNKTKIAEQNEIARMKLEIQEMIARLKEGGLNNRWGTPSGNVQLQEQGRNDRWGTPSGNAELGAITQRRGQDLTFDTNKMRDTTVQRGQNMGRENVLDTLNNSIARTRMNNATTERGQDIGAESSRFGTTSANFRAGLPKAPLFSFTPEGGVAPGPGTPGSNKTPPAAPGLPPSFLNGVRLPGGGGQPQASAPVEDRSALESQASQLMQAFDAEKDPTKRSQLRQQMTAIAARLRTIKK